MSGDDIVKRLREYAHIVQSDRYDDGELLEEAAAEIERLRAERYVDDLGVDWCVLHNGVRNEDSDRCDAFDWSDEDDMLDEDGEYLPCDLRPLAYRETERLWDERRTERAEVERLRAAGDALAESLEHSRADIRAAAHAWQEARRG